MKSMTEIYSIASSLQLFGSITQKKIASEDTLPERIQLTLGIKGVISYSSTIDPKGRLSSKKIKKIRSSLLLFFLGQLTQEKLERKIIKYNKPSAIDEVQQKNPEISLTSAAQAHLLLTMTEVLLKIGGILNQFKKNDLPKWNDGIVNLDLEQLQDFWACFYDWSTTIPNKEKFSLEQIIEAPIGTNPLHHIVGADIELLKDSYQLLVRFNALSEKKCFLKREFAGGEHESDGRLRPGALVEAEKSVVQSLDNLYTTLAITKNKLQSEVIKRMF